MTDLAGRRAAGHRRLISGLLLALCCFAGLASPAAAQRFGAETFTLANGLQVVVLPKRGVPAVTQMVWYKTGAADDPRGKSGIAHFLEHLMFKGTAANPPGTFTASIAQTGGRDNAFTSQDVTVFHETVAKERLEMVMRLEADRMTGLQISDAVLLPEREVILEERRMRIDNDPTALFREQLTANLFLHDSYRVPTIGWEHEMRTLNTEDALAAYRKWYAPNNAVLIVSGDVETAEVHALAERIYGPLQARPIPERLRLEEPPHRAAVRLEMKHPRVAQPSFRRSYIAPSYRAGATEHAYALQVLAEILGGGSESRLYQNLVLKQGIALAVHADYAPSALGLSSFGIYASAKPGVAIPDLEAAIDAELRRVLQQGVEPDEVKRAEARMQAAAIYSADSHSGPANIIGTALAIGQSLDDVAAWPDRIGAVTPAEIGAAARTVLVEPNSATGILLPEHTS